MSKSVSLPPSPTSVRSPPKSELNRAARDWNAVLQGPGKFLNGGDGLEMRKQQSGLSMLTDAFFLVVRATHTQEVLGEQGRRIRELTSLIQKRFKFPENSVSLYAAKVQNRGLSAVAQCESLRYKLLNGLAVRRACYGVLRFIMESGAKGCEVVVSGKLRAARAKSMKFTVRLHRGMGSRASVGILGMGLNPSSDYPCAIFRPCAKQ